MLCTDLFGTAAEGAAKVDDHSRYQMDIANCNEALREVSLDIKEGADIIMVKPTHTFLDIIHKVKTIYPFMQITAYHVSGEYAMLQAAIQNGWIEEKHGILGSVISKCRKQRQKSDSVVLIKKSTITHGLLHQNR